MQDSEEENENDSDERETLSDANKARRDNHVRVCPIHFVSFSLVEVSQATKLSWRKIRDTIVVIYQFVHVDMAWIMRN